jgi:DNA polymerase III sliding clamp (beta) subunit (PCNA family)
VKEGKLTIVSADGFRLAVVKLDFDGDDGEVLINREDLRGIANALRHAKRVRVSLEKSGDTLDPDKSGRLILDTELIRYRWQGVSGNFPDYEKLIPSQPRPVGASFDTTEAIKAVSSLKVLAYAKSYPIDLTIGNGKLIMSNPDDKGQTEIPADTEGEVKVRLDGSYLAEALRACGGMVELKLIDGKSPMLFAVDGYELVTMPMMTTDKPAPKTEATEPVASAVAEAEAVAEAHTEAEAVAEAPTEKPKRKRSKAKEPVAV